MNIDEFQSYLEQCVERRCRPDREKVQSALESSPAMLEIWTDFQVVEQALLDWEPMDDAPDLTERVLTELSGTTITPAQTNKEPKPSSRTATLALALTACLALLVLVPLIGGFFQSPPALEFANSTDPEKTTPVVTSASQPVRIDRLFGHTRGAYGSLMVEARSSLGELEQMIDLPDILPGNDSLKTDESNPSTEPSQLQALGEELRESVGFLYAFYPSSDSGL